MYVPDNARFAKRAARILGYKYTDLDNGNGYCFKVENNGAHFISGAGRVCSYPINNATAFCISKDKYHTYRVLKNAGIKTPETKIFFLTDSHKNLRNDGFEMNTVFKENFKYPFFIKPNLGSKGDFAQIVENRKQLVSYIDRVKRKYDAVVTQPFIKGVEHRVLFLNGECRYQYTREAPSLVGNGVASLSSLIMEFNQLYDGIGISPLDEESLLALCDMDGQSIPDSGEQIMLIGRSNISVGGSIKNFTLNIHDSYQKLCKKVADEMNLSIMGLDLFELEDGTVYVLEVNSNPSIAALEEMGHSELAIKIWQDVMLEYFKRSKGK